MIEELNFYKKEIQTLRSEKDALENSLNNKQGDIRKIMNQEVRRAEEDMRKTSNQQKNENLKLTQ